MLQFLLDTDHLTLMHYRHAPLVGRLALQPSDSVGVSAVTLEEALRGRLAAISAAKLGPARVLAYARLLATVSLLRPMNLVEFDQKSEVEFQHLRSIRLRIGVQDLKIAAVALVNNLTLLTRNRHDFGQIPGLTIDDRSV